MKPKKDQGRLPYFFRKYEKGKLEHVILFHVDDIFMDGKPETLKNIKENIKEKFIISESMKMKKLLGIYYE